jgi:hypothetical protein
MAFFPILFATPEPISQPMSSNRSQPHHKSTGPGSSDLAAIANRMRQQLSQESSAKVSSVASSEPHKGLCETGVTGPPLLQAPKRRTRSTTLGTREGNLVRQQVSTGQSRAWDQT